MSATDPEYTVPHRNSAPDGPAPGIDCPPSHGPEVGQTEPFAGSVGADSGYGPRGLLPPGSRLGRYRIRRELGHGGMSVVYLAEDEELGRQVAVKLPRFDRLSSDELNRSVHEARVLARLNHPAIVPIYDFGREADGTCYLVMEYVPGGSLDQVLRVGPVVPGRAARLLAEVAVALHAAHKRGFVHRDIKPGNILLDADGRPRIADFDLAVHEDRHRDCGDEYAGTLCYMAPEQLEGAPGKLDGRADIWALGTVLYECLCGRRPFCGDTTEQLRKAILESQPSPPRQIDGAIPAALERVCLKCLSKNVKGRYRTARSLARALRRAVRPSQVRRRLILAAALVALFSGILLSVTWWRSRAVIAPPSAASATLDAPSAPGGNK